MLQIGDDDGENDDADVGNRLLVLSVLETEAIFVASSCRISDCKWADGQIEYAQNTKRAWSWLACMRILVSLTHAHAFPIHQLGASRRQATLTVDTRGKGKRQMTSRASVCEHMRHRGEEGRQLDHWLPKPTAGLPTNPTNAISVISNCGRNKGMSTVGESTPISSNQLIINLKAPFLQFKAIDK